VEKICFPVGRPALATPTKGENRESGQ
jgi:hypothetical protein